MVTGRCLAECNPVRVLSHLWRGVDWAWTDLRRVDWHCRLLWSLHESELHAGGRSEHQPGDWNPCTVPRAGLAHRGLLRWRQRCAATIGDSLDRFAEA